MNKKISYDSYLALDKILNAQRPKSSELENEIHDEMLFITTHQAYELWFKQILHELNSIIKLFLGEYFYEGNLGIVVSRLDRVIEIQKILVNQITVLETMTPMDFLEFRDLLTPSSGFQSTQFRLIEIKLGMIKDHRIQYGDKNYNEYLNQNDSDKVIKTEKELSLFKLVERWLERIPFIQTNNFNFWSSYKNSVEKMINYDIQKLKKVLKNDKSQLENNLKHYEKIKINYNSLFDKNKYLKLQETGEKRLSQKATLGALFIQLYRDEPILQLPHRLIKQLIDIDHLFTSWRSRHMLLVHRMIGEKIGTGGSSGYKYLKDTAENHTIFSDFSNLSTFIIPRSQLPILPSELIEKLGFHLTYGK